MIIIGDEPIEFVSIQDAIDQILIEFNGSNYILMWVNGKPQEVIHHLEELEYRLSSILQNSSINYKFTTLDRRRVEIKST